MSRFGFFYYCFRQRILELYLNYLFIIYIRDKNIKVCRHAFWLVDITCTTMTIVKAKFQEKRIKTDVKNNLLEPRPFALSFSSFFKDLLPFSSSPYRYSRWAGPARPPTGKQASKKSYRPIYKSKPTFNLCLVF